MGRGRVHRRPFKLSAVQQVASGEKRPAQVCREHSITEGVLLRWRRKYEARGEAAFAPHQPSETEALARRVAELERLCGQLGRVRKPLLVLGQSTEGSGGLRPHDSPGGTWGAGMRYRFEPMSERHTRAVAGWR